jgi:hypothetical protein
MIVLDQLWLTISLQVKKTPFAASSGPSWLRLKVLEGQVVFEGR